MRLLPDRLLGRRGLVELAGLAVGGGHAEGLLQELARLEAVGPGEALGLHGRLPLRGDDDFNDAGHHGPSRAAGWRSDRATFRWSRSIAWKARLRRLTQRASAARSLASRARSACARRWRCWADGSGVGTGRTMRRRGAGMSGPPDDLELD